MRIPVRDVLATVFVAGSSAVAVLWLTGTSFTGLPDRRVVLVVLALGLAGCSTDQTGLAEVYGAQGNVRAPMGYVVASTTAGVVALAAGIAALAAPSATTLAVLTAATVLLWALATARHLLRARGGDAGAPRTGEVRGALSS